MNNSANTSVVTGTNNNQLTNSLKAHSDRAIIAMIGRADIEGSKSNVATNA